MPELKQELCVTHTGISKVQAVGEILEFFSRRPVIEVTPENRVFLGKRKREDEGVCRLKATPAAHGDFYTGSESKG